MSRRDANSKLEIVGIAIDKEEAEKIAKLFKGSKILTVEEAEKQNLTVKDFPPEKLTVLLKTKYVIVQEKPEKGTSEDIRELRSNPEETRRKDEGSQSKERDVKKLEEELKKLKERIEKLKSGEAE